jgi:hypothetical protein
MIRRVRIEPKVKTVQKAKIQRQKEAPLDHSLLPKDFNSEEYLQLNKDVAASPDFSSIEGAKRHWILWGHREGRAYKQEYFGYEEKVRTEYSTERSTKNKKVIYTCILGDYDILKDPINPNPGWDYVCFTNMNFESNVWSIEQIPQECMKEDPMKIQRMIKILPHRYLPEYEISIWIDGNMQMVIDPSIFLSKYGKMSFNTMAHPERTCMYDEMQACLDLKKETPERITVLLQKYEIEGLPRENGLIQSGILIRKHLEREVKVIDEMWWDLVKTYSHRDQLTFNYITWKYPFQIGLFSATVLFSEFNFFRHKDGYYGMEIGVSEEYGKTTKFNMKKNSDLPRDFNWKFYLELNPDVKAHHLFNTKEGAAKHWLEWGESEGRAYRRPHDPWKHFIKNPTEFKSSSSGNGIVFELPHSISTSGGVRETIKLSEAMGASIRFQRLEDYPTTSCDWTVGPPDNTFPSCDVCITYSDNPHAAALLNLPQVKRVYVMMLSYGMSITRERRNVKTKGITVFCSSKKIERAIIEDGGSVKRVGFSLDMDQMKNMKKKRKKYLAILFSPSEGKMYQTAVAVANRLYKNGQIEGVISFGTSRSYENFQHPLGLIKHYADATPEEVAEVFNLCKCYLMPSITEGINLTPIESTLCGCPSIIVDGAIGEIFIDGTNCIVSKPEVKTLADEVVKVLSNYENLSSKFAFSMEEIVKNHTIESVIKNIRESI